MSKRLVVKILVVCMLVGVLGVGGFARAGAIVVPGVGDALRGFTVTDIREEKILKCQTATLIHDKTGAQVLYIAADDADAAFDISFRTPSMDDKGIPHVFEHITISGSEKYPAQNLFFPLATQSYMTSINAMTSQRMTTYPLSSLSDAQLLKLADFYLDGVFNPMIYKDERFYRREAWRYELKDMDAPLTLTGTVYNEMRGNLNIQSAANTNLLRALYPGSIIGNESGGNPHFIPEMAYQELLDFHAAYYHPSNSLTVLYGRLNLDAFLEKLDGYFSRYEKREFSNIEMGQVPLREAFFEAVYTFPVEAGAPTENASIVTYAFALPAVEYEKGFDIDVLLGMISDDDSPLTRAIYEKLPGAQLYVSVDMDQPDPYLVFILNGVNAADRTVFKEIVDASLRQISEEGIGRDRIEAMIDTTIASIEYALLPGPEGSQGGVDLAVMIATEWANHGTTNYMNMMVDRADKVRRIARDGYFEQMLNDLLLENPRAVLIATEPAPGGANQETAELEAKLAAVKAEMSDEEIRSIIEEGKAFEAWSREEAPRSMIESLQAVTADVLPVEVKAYEITEGETDGVRTLTVRIDMEDIGNTELFLDTSAMPLELLHDLNLYISLIGMVDTQSHELADVQTLMDHTLSGFGAVASKNRYADGSWNPVVHCSWMNPTQAYETAADLVRELLFTSQINDLKILQAVILQTQLGVRDMLNTAGYAEQAQRAMAVAFEDEAYMEYLSGLAYYAYLKEAERMLTEDPDTLVKNLEAARDALLNKQNAVLLFAGDDAGLNAFETYAGKVFEGIEATPILAAQLNLPRPATKEALVVDSKIQYNMVSASLADMGIEYSATFDVLSLLLYDTYLTPRIRHGIGAYDNFVNLNDRGFLFYTYRDPSIAESFAVYEGLPAFAAEADVTQADIDRYIVSAYAKYVTKQSDLTGAMNALHNRMLGWPDDQMLLEMRQIKATTVDDLRALAPAFEKMLEEGTRSTSGGAAIIEKNATLFDEIVNLQSGAETEDASTVTNEEDTEDAA